MKKRFLPFTLFLLTLSSLTAQWEPKAFNTLPVGYFVSSISIVNDQVIWAVAIDYSLINPPLPANHVIKLLKSIDGGDTWEVKDIGDAIGRFSLDIHAFDENTACITTQNYLSPTGRGVFRTTDGGDSWDEVHLGNDGGLWIHFFDDQEGVCINGFSGYRGRTTDGGVNWVSETILDFQSGEGGVFESPSSSIEILGDNLWFGTNQGRVFKSTDRGQTWNTTPMNLSGNFIYSIAFVDEQNGLALHATNYQLAKTTDGGATWESVNSGYDFTEVIAIPCSNIFMGVSYNDNITAISTDCGETWELLVDDISAWVPIFKSPNLGWMAEGTLSGPGNPALYKWIGGPLNGRTYVNHAAMGNNDGTSWTDAYTDLKVAIDSAEAGDEIWVAEGTYLPGSDPTATFLIDKNLQLYGGFTGTECNLGERDIVLHPTILSGDVDSNDVVDDFVTNRGDNLMTVVTMTANVTNETVLDGFTISNGHADGNNSGQQKSGGGIFSLGVPIISNCVFEQNFAVETGGAIDQGSNSNSAIILENCLFQHNSAMQGLAVRLNLASFDINNCNFWNNTNPAGITGGLHILNPRGGAVRNCHFKENLTDQYGGMFVNLLSSSGLGDVQIEVLDCIFENNVTDNGAGGLFLATGGYNSNYVVKRCNFIGNSSNLNAGAIGLAINGASENASILIDSCQFSQNVTKDNGSAVYTVIRGKNAALELNRCEFIQNTSDQYAAAVYLWGTGGVTGEDTGIIMLDSCYFMNNTSVFSGALEMGVGHNGGGDYDFYLTNSTFVGNVATEGGAITLWHDEVSKADFFVDNCKFDGNTATLRGAGISIAPVSSDFHVTINRTEIVNNQSQAGAIIDIYPSSLGSGFPANASCNITNTLIANNASDNAAISVDSLPNFQLLNCTIADNSGGGIQIANQSGITLQNTILHNNGTTEFEALTTDVTVTSLGGNLIGDDSFDEHDVPTDLQNTNPQFNGSGDPCDYYQLNDTSPAINAGTEPDTPSEFDLCGNDRVQDVQIDIGALESPHPTALKEVIAGEIHLSPNPTSDFINVQLPESITQPNEISLFDAQGKSVRLTTLSTSGQMDVHDLSPGFYVLKTVAGGHVYIGRFVKQ